jgi:hypothetical protein
MRYERTSCRALALAAFFLVNFMGAETPGTNTRNKRNAMIIKTAVGSRHERLGFTSRGWVKVVIKLCGYLLILSSSTSASGPMTSRIFTVSTPLEKS